MLKTISTPLKKRLFTVTPYAAVFLGLYVFKNAFLSILLYHAGVLTSIYLYRKELDIRDIFSFNSKRLTLIISLICGMSGISILLIWDLIKLPGLNLTRTMSEIGLTGNTKVLFLIYFSTIHPFVEELFWRFLLKTKARYISMDDVLFALYHVMVLALFLKLQYIVICFVALIGVARFWRYLQHNLSENMAVILSHAVADFSIMFFVMTLY